MKLRIATSVALGVGFIFGIAVAPGNAQEARITVYNPMGTPPPIQMKAMASRLDTLEGKTIFLVNTGFPNSGPFMEAMKEWFADNHPKINTVVVTSLNLTDAIKDEISKKADAVLFGVGH